ncbi:MAG: hypothetical protein ABWY96_09670 [Gaiellaceae bacterium]|jgi:hypothetical protein
MALLRQNDDTVRTETVERTEHVWSGPPVVRGLTTLLCVAIAGFLVWLASEFDLGSTGEYWAAMGILAGAGAVLGLSQLLGGWTKWGAPTISLGVLLLAFVPTLVAVGGILVATRPTGTDEGEDVAGWIRDIGLGGLAENLFVFQGVLAFGLGVVFAFTFDTRGPRMRTVERDTEVIDEEVHDYRDETAVEEDETVVVHRVPQ